MAYINLFETFKHTLTKQSLQDFDHDDYHDAVMEHHHDLSEQTNTTHFSEEERDDLKQYSAAGSAYLNSYLIKRHNAGEAGLPKTTSKYYDGTHEKSEHKELNRQLSSINGAIDKAEPLRNEGHFYCGVGAAYGRKLFDAKVGKSLFSPALLSTSIRHRVSETFAPTVQSPDVDGRHDAWFHKNPDHEYWHSGIDASPVGIKTILHLHLPEGFNHGLYIGATRRPEHGEDMDYLIHDEKAHPLTHHRDEHEYLIRNALHWEVKDINMFQHWDVKDINMFQADPRRSHAFHKVVTIVPHSKYVTPKQGDLFR